MKHLIWIFAIIVSLNTSGQNSDCNTAISVCNATYQENNSPSGTGNVSEVLLSSCQFGEFNSAWYVFTAQESGPLSFTLSPNDFLDDYDWSLFNITTGGCEGINTGASPEVSCNSWGTLSGQVGETGISSAAGGSGNSNGPGDTNGPPFNSDLQINAGDVYALVIMNYSATLNGYTLDFSQSQSSIFDQTPPFITATDPGCDQSAVTFHISESIPNDQLTLGNMTFTTNSGTLTPTGLDATNSSTANFTVNFGASNTYSGPVTLTFNTPPTDYCGNPMPLAYTFNVDGQFTAPYTTTPACNGENGSLTITPDGLGNACYSFNADGAPVLTATCDQASATGLSAGTHHIVVTADSSSCFLSFDITIADQIVSVDLGEDQILCDLHWQANVSFVGNTFSWQPQGGLNFSAIASPQSNLTASTAGQYTITGTAAINTCTASDEVNITFNNPPVMDFITTPVSCYGNCDGTIAMINPNGDVVTANIGNNNQSGVELSFGELCSGEYTVIVNFGDNCTVQYAQTVHTPPQVTADFIANRYITSIDDPSFSLVSTSNNADSLVWKIPDLPEFGSTSETWDITLPAEAKTYTIQLLASDTSGCTDLMEKTLIVRDRFEIYVPNSFTPNDDGINDVFLPQFSYLPEVYELQIFNRWGDMIFETKDPAKAWLGGRESGEYYSPDGVYNWRMKTKTIGQDSRELQGFVILMR